MRRAGLGRVTVSLHSLEPETFGRINGLGLELERVLEGIEAAVAAGLEPVKLNIVVIQGVNDHEIIDLARYGRDQGCVVRFIEYMDVGTVNAWDPGEGDFRRADRQAASMRSSRSSRSAGCGPETWRTATATATAAARSASSPR